MSRQVSYQTKEHKGTYTKEYKRGGSCTSQELQRAVDAFHNYYDIPAAGRRWKYDREDEELILARYRKGGLVGKHRPEPSRKETPGAASTSTPALKTVSWLEVRPEGAWSSALQRPVHWCDGFARYLADALGFAEPPRLRWFTNATEGAKQGPGWHQALFPASTRVPRGAYDPTTGDLWLEYHLSEGDAKFILAHEFRHAWQCRTYGPSYVNEHREAAEADADAFADKHR